MTGWGISKLTVRPTLAVVLRYGLAVPLIAIALAIAVITRLHHSPPRFVSHFFLLAIAITFWCAGTGPGMLALLLSCLGVGVLARKDFLTPDFPLVQFLIFFVVFSLLMSLFSASRRRAQKQLVEARDALELRVAERTDELQRSEAYLAEAQRLTQTGSWARNPLSEITYWSEECYRVLGFDPQGPPPPFETVLRRIHPDDQAFCRERVEKGVRDKVDFEFDYRIIHPDKGVRVIHDVCHPVLDRSGNLVELLGSVVDITERKRAEQLQADLTHASRVSTMGEMVASISHELAQPVQITTAHAKASLRWLQRDPPDMTEVRKGTEKIMEAGTLASEIINRLRSLYKKALPKRELVTINEVVGEMAGMMEGEARGHGVSIRTDLKDDIPMTVADRVQLQQVLMNLMLNGIEAMRDTGGVLTVKSQLGEDGQIQISIHDTGPGLPMGKADQIFDAFFTTKPQGSGMGLAICKSIVESHDGRIWANGDCGRGATFHFTLPAAPAETNPPVDAA
jgi:signal transduction histidine kinase